MNTDYMYLEHTDPTPQIVVLEVSFMFMKNINYLVIDPGTRQAVIVDPAWQMEKIDKAVTDAGVQLNGVLLTHSHPDHVHLARPVAEKYDCPIWMSREEITVSGFDARQLIAIDETPWNIGRTAIRPILTPGHTPGCVCYLIGDNLFTGDVLFAEGCGICPDARAAHAMFASLEHLKSRLEPHTRIFPGHSYGKPPGQRFSQLLKDNIYLQFTDKHSFAAFRLRPGQNRLKMFDFN